MTLLVKGSAMWEFLQAYGSWIIFGLFFLLMVGMHGRGGHGMGHGEHTARPATPADEKARSAGEPTGTAHRH